MKKLILLLLFIPLVFSCTKEDCDCGIVEAKNFQVVNGTEWEYYMDIRNDCTGDIENNVQFTENVFYQRYPGDDICDITSKRLN